MELAEALAALEQAGTEQTRKTYRRHGAPEPLFGVKFGDLGVIAKRIKVNHQLALALWESGNFDARNLALKVADPKQASAALLQRWAGDLQNYSLCDELSGFVGKTELGPELAAGWIASGQEWLMRLGWNCIGQVAMHDGARPEAWFMPYLERGAASIHAAPNRAKDGVLNAIIAIGMRGGALEDAALAAAASIGVVKIDHGETGCRTPDIVGDIARAKAHRARKAEKKAS
ncbi:MAG: DNA alkylation repair protein [Dehalococcoidia bacterium]